MRYIGEGELPFRHVGCEEGAGRNGYLKRNLIVLLEILKQSTKVK